MKTLTVLSPDGSPDATKTGMTCQPGDKVFGTFWGGEADLEILENIPSRLRWKGVWHGLVAIRTFAYEEAEGGRTKFTQSEEAKGFMGGVLKVDGWMGGNLAKKFASFNRDLKMECEKQG